MSQYIQYSPLGGGGGSASDSFTTIQTDDGSNPVASSPADTLILTSSDASVYVLGDSGTKTVDLTVDPTQGSLATALDSKVTIGGDSLGADLSIGTSDAYALILETSGSERLRISDDGLAYTISAALNSQATLQIASATSGNDSGTEFRILGSDGNGSGLGGGFQFKPGNSNSGNGGDAFYQAGDSTSSTGGTLYLQSGASQSGDGGNVVLQANNNNDNTGFGGNVTIQAGNGDTAGSVTISSGIGLSAPSPISLDPRGAEVQIQDALQLPYSTASRALELDASKNVVASAVTGAELALLSGKTSLMSGAGAVTDGRFAVFSGTSGTAVQQAGGLGWSNVYGTNEPTITAPTSITINVGAADHSYFTTTQLQLVGATRNLTWTNNGTSDVGANTGLRPRYVYANLGFVAKGDGLYLDSVGKTVIFTAGVNATIGTGAALVGGTVTVNTTAVTANSMVILTKIAAGGTEGFVRVTKTPGVSFTIDSSSGTDTSTFDWLIVERQ